MRLKIEEYVQGVLFFVFFMKLWKWRNVEFYAFYLSYINFFLESYILSYFKILSHVSLTVYLYASLFVDLYASLLLYLYASLFLYLYASLFLYLYASLFMG